MFNKKFLLIFMSTMHSLSCVNFTAKEREQINKDAQRSDLRNYECIGTKNSDGTFESLDDLRKKGRDNISKMLKLIYTARIKDINDTENNERREEIFARALAELECFSTDPDCENVDTQRKIAYWKNELYKANAHKKYPAWLLGLGKFFGYFS
jgi:hypothetical protein